MEYAFIAITLKSTLTRKLFESHQWVRYICLRIICIQFDSLQKLEKI